jgi:hypothetical protein
VARQPASVSVLHATRRTGDEGEKLTVLRDSGWPQMRVIRGADKTPSNAF